MWMYWTGVLGYVAVPPCTWSCPVVPVGCVGNWHVQHVASLLVSSVLGVQLTCAGGRVDLCGVCVCHHHHRFLRHHWPPSSPSLPPPPLALTSITMHATDPNHCSVVSLGSSASFGSHAVEYINGCPRSARRRRRRRPRRRRPRGRTTRHAAATRRPRLRGRTDSSSSTCKATQCSEGRWLPSLLPTWLSQSPRQ